MPDENRTSACFSVAAPGGRRWRCCRRKRRRLRWRLELIRAGRAIKFLDDKDVDLTQRDLAARARQGHDDIAGKAVAPQRDWGVPRPELTVGKTLAARHLRRGGCGVLPTHIAEMEPCYSRDSRRSAPCPRRERACWPGQPRRCRASRTLANPLGRRPAPRTPAEAPRETTREDVRRGGGGRARRAWKGRWGRVPHACCVEPRSSSIQGSFRFVKV